MTAEARCQPHEKKYFHTFPTIFLLKKWLPIHWDNSKRCFSSVFQSLYVLVLVDLYPAKEWSESVFLSVFFKAIATLPPWAALIFWPQPFLNYAHSSFWQWLVDIFPRLRWYISLALKIWHLCKCLVGHSHQFRQKDISLTSFWIFMKKICLICPFCLDIMMEIISVLKTH